MARLMNRMVASSLVILAVTIGHPPPLLAKPTTYRISHFADEFHATVTVEDTKEVFKPGAVSVFDSRTGKRLLRVESEELAFELKNGEAPANIRELPYGEQSVLIYEDFDFDGRSDLAIMDGQKSCYHGPSFQIFLRTGRSFVQSAPFTELAQEFCGMFQVDRASKRLATMTKSGCCWHQYNTYSVVNHTPVLIQSVQESQSGFCPAYYERTTTAGQRTSTEYLLLLDGDPRIKPLVAFDLAGGRQKRVEVFAVSAEDKWLLDYALVVGRDRRVEFSYQLDVLGARSGKEPHTFPPFRWDPSARELGFRSGAYRYVVHDRPERLGIAVHVGARVTFLEGESKSRRGDLGGLRVKDFVNLELPPKPRPGK